MKQQQNKNDYLPKQLDFQNNAIKSLLQIQQRDQSLLMQWRKQSEAAQNNMYEQGMSRTNFKSNNNRNQGKNMHNRTSLNAFDCKASNQIFSKSLSPFKRSKNRNRVLLKKWSNITNQINISQDESKAPEEGSDHFGLINSQELSKIIKASQSQNNKNQFEDRKFWVSKVKWAIEYEKPHTKNIPKGKKINIKSYFNQVCKNNNHQRQHSKDKIKYNQYKTNLLQSLLSNENQFFKYKQETYKKIRNNLKNPQQNQQNTVFVFDKYEGTGNCCISKNQSNYQIRPVFNQHEGLQQKCKGQSQSCQMSQIKYVKSVSMHHVMRDAHRKLSVQIHNDAFKVQDSRRQCSVLGKHSQQQRSAIVRKLLLNLKNIKNNQSPKSNQKIKSYQLKKSKSIKKIYTNAQDQKIINLAMENRKQDRQRALQTYNKNHNKNGDKLIPTNKDSAYFMNNYCKQINFKVDIEKPYISCRKFIKNNLISSKDHSSSKKTH